MTAPLCLCGCGQQTKPAPVNFHAQGIKKGDYFRYVRGHNARKAGPKYIIDPDTGCWNWQRHKNRDGYGRLTVNRATWMAHRWYWIQAGNSLAEGEQLHHVCQNKSCVNPDHLECVPIDEHTSLHHAAGNVLTREIAHQIRNLVDGGWKRSDVAEAFGVTDVVVGFIARREAWV